MIFIITREDAIEILKDGAWWSMVDIMLPCDGAASKALHDAVDTAIAALRTQPVKLDRSWWEGCNLCNNPTISGFTTYCGYQYCKNCGRPLTEAAWMELERRINGGTTD